MFVYEFLIFCPFGMFGENGCGYETIWHYLFCSNRNVAGLNASGTEGNGIIYLLLWVMIILFVRFVALELKLFL